MKRAIYTVLAALSLTTITTVEAARTLNWSLHNGKDITGTREISRVFTNLEACQRACAEIKECGALVKHTNHDLCILHEISEDSTTFASEHTTVYMAEVDENLMSEAKALAMLFGNHPPSSILEPWAHYSKYNITNTIEVGNYNNVTLDQCKMHCMRDILCTAVVMTGSGSCSLRHTSHESEIVSSFEQDTYSKDLPYMYNFSSMPVFGAALDVIVLYDVEWSEIDEPEDSVWTEWSPCVGACGGQIRARGCTGKVCKGSALQVCIDKSICCTYQKIAGLTPALLIPLYITPAYDIAKCTQMDFNAVAKSCQGATVVLNIDNGPGYNIDPEYLEGFKTCVSYIGNHGVRSLGYVYTKTSTYQPSTGYFTNTGFRNYAETLDDVYKWMRTWGNLPGFSGIFLDEVSTAYQAIEELWHVNHIAWYQDMINDIKAINPKLDVVLNSGTACPIQLVMPGPGFPSPASTAVIYEGAVNHWADHCTSYRAGPYCSLAPDSIISGIQARVESGLLKGSAMLYGTTQSEALTALDVARDDNLAFFYTSVINLPANPWDSVPDYFNNLLEALNNY